MNEYDEYGNPKKFSKHEEVDDYGNLKGKIVSKFKDLWQIIVGPFTN